jgi:hypothetical protein
MRQTLTLAVLTGAVALAMWLFASTSEGRFFKLERTSSNLQSLAASAISGTAMPTSTTTVLSKPHYSGQDISGQSWSIKADQAEQQGGISSSIVVLTNVAAYWQGGTEQSAVLSAKQAAFNQASSMLNLTGEVSLTGAGLHFMAPVMQVSIASRTAVATAKGTSAVVIKGQLGRYTTTLTGGQLNANYTSQLFSLSGGVKAHLVPAQGL